MQHSIEILDYIEENENAWMQTCEKMKNEIFQGLGELANFNLTQDSRINFSGLLTEKAGITVTENWELQGTNTTRLNSYLTKSRGHFAKALSTALEIVPYKVGLHSVLSNNFLKG